MSELSGDLVSRVESTILEQIGANPDVAYVVVEAHVSGEHRSTLQDLHGEENLLPYLQAYVNQALNNLSSAELTADQKEKIKEFRDYSNEQASKDPYVIKLD